MPETQVVEWVREKYVALVEDLDERGRRRWAGAEARSLGWTKTNMKNRRRSATIGSLKYESNTTHFTANGITKSCPTNN